MTKALTEKKSGALVSNGEWTPEQKNLIKSTVAKGTSDDELKLFLYTCKMTGLDPLIRQIHAVKRWDSAQGKEAMAIQVGIDGYRLTAQRTGEMDGQDGPYWCGDDGEWRDVWLTSKPPVAAKVVVYRKGHTHPYIGIARYEAYVQKKKGGEPNHMWSKMGDAQLAKCFSPETQVLTEHGFKKFQDVGSSRIMQVTDTGVEAVPSVPFSQKYSGDMIVNDGDMLNFSVTPNHDMVTTLGKVEARAMFNTTPANYKTRWRIPLTVPSRMRECPVSDRVLELTGYLIADGWSDGNGTFNVSVSKRKKIEALSKMCPRSTGVVHSKGKESDAGIRTIRTNFDKQVFRFDAQDVALFLDEKKNIHLDEIAALSWRQARVLLDAWQRFDGYTNRKTSVRRLYTSREDHVSAIEVLAVISGYSINVPKERVSDISIRKNYYVTLAEPKAQPVIRPIGSRTGIHIEKNETGEVWCVTVPSGRVVVRRNGFSMVCGNCAEALALRKAFPNELSGTHTEEELAHSTQDEPDFKEPQEKAVDVEPQPTAKTPSIDKSVKVISSKGFKRDGKTVYDVTVEDQEGPFVVQTNDLELAKKAKALEGKDAVASIINAESTIPGIVEIRAA